MSQRGLHCTRLHLSIVLTLSCYAVLPPPATAQTGPSTPYELRALYLFNFAKYTEWPRETFADGTVPFVLGILGDDPFGKDIDIIKGKPVKNRELVVRYFRRAEEIADCHILYVSPSEKENLGKILKAVNGASVLTVSEVEGFMEQDGIVKLAEEKNRLVFEINQAAAEKARLKLDARLLQLAKTVRK